jgi:hypothetical protein
MSRRTEHRLGEGCETGLQSVGFALSLALYGALLVHELRRDMTWRATRPEFNHWRAVCTRARWYAIWRIWRSMRTYQRTGTNPLFRRRMDPRPEGKGDHVVIGGRTIGMA